MDLVDASKNLMIDALAAVATHVSLHSAYPGTTGANEISGGAPAYARKAVAWGPSVGGSKPATAALDFNVAGATTVQYGGLWSAATGGTFYGSFPLGPVGDPKIAVALAGTDVFNAVAHGWANGQQIAIAKTLGPVPTGITDGAVLFVVSATTDTFKVSATAGGAAIDITAGGTAIVRALTPEVFGGQGTYQVTSVSLNQS